MSELAEITAQAAVVRPPNAQGPLTAVIVFDLPNYGPLALNREQFANLVAVGEKAMAEAIAMTEAAQTDVRMAAPPAGSA